MTGREFCTSADVNKRAKNTGSLKRPGEEGKGEGEGRRLFFNTAPCHVFSSSLNIMQLSGDLPAQTDIHFKIWESLVECQCSGGNCSVCEYIPSFKCLSCCFYVCASELCVCVCERVWMNTWIKSAGERCANPLYCICPQGQSWDRSGSSVTAHTQRYMEQ